MQRFVRSYGRDARMKPAIGTGVLVGQRIVLILAFAIPAAICLALMAWLVVVDLQVLGI